MDNPPPPARAPGAPTPRARLVAPLLILAVAAGLECLCRGLGLRLPNPGALLLLALAYGTFVSGLRTGMCAAVLTLGYLGLINTVPEGPWLRQPTAMNLGRMAVFVVSAPGIVLVVGLLRRRLAHALAAEGWQRAEAARRAGEERLRLIVDSARDFAIVATDPAGRITTWNAGAEAVFGWPAAEAVGQPLAMIFTPEDRAAGVAEREMATARDRGRASDERWHLRRDGSRFYASGVVAAMRDGAGEFVGYVKVCRDLTEPRRTEEGLRVSEERHRLALEGARLGSFHWRLPEGVIHWDARMKELFGLPADAEVDFARFQSCLHPDDRERVDRAIADALANRTTYDLEYRVLTPADAARPVRWIHASGRGYYDARTGEPTRFDGVAVDVTDRRRAQEDLRLSEQRLRLATAAAELGTFFCPVPLGEIIWNDRCKELFFLPPDAQVDFERFYAILHPDDREPTRRAIARALAERGPYDVEYRTVAPGGQRTRWVRAIGRGYYDGPDGELTRFDGIAIDVSDRKRSESAIRQARDAAEEANRLKDEFLATLSHELRTPLNAILGWTHLMRAEPDDAETRREALEIIERNTRAQVQLIEDLLDVSRIISGKMRLEVRPVAVEEVVRGALAAVRPTAEARGVRLQAVLDPGAGPVSGDPDRLQQVVWNLLSNAIKFTPKSGRVQVRLEQHVSSILVVVSDTGQGIAPDFLPHVFDRFRQADSSSRRSHAGLGLGLALVRHLVELHGGSVAAVSPGPGQGATFTVRLPLAIMHSVPRLDGVAEPRQDRAGVNHQAASDGTGPAQQATAAPGSPASPAVRRDLEGVRVLAVDDDADARGLLQAVLARHGAVVTALPNAAAGLAALTASRPDVLLCDIEMPGEDGYELIGKVRALAADAGGTVPAVALPAYARTDDRRRALAAGFQRHLSKPVEPEELVLVLAGLVGRRPGTA